MPHIASPQRRYFRCDQSRRTDVLGAGQSKRIPQTAVDLRTEPARRRWLARIFSATTGPTPGVVSSGRHTSSSRMAQQGAGQPREYPPERPYCRASSITSAASRLASSRPRGTLRCVERCCPSAAQTRRSETCKCARTCAMQTRRCAGLRSFILAASRRISLSSVRPGAKRLLQHNRPSADIRSAAV